MTASGDAILHRRLRAPRNHGGALIDPPLNAAADALARNRAQRDEAVDIGGRRLGDLLQSARHELLELAETYVRNYVEVSSAPGPRDLAAAPSTPAPPIIMTGHQPQLYHPGVWFKNFALSSLARRQGARAINLLIDNDTLRSASIRVPTGSPDAPHMESVPYDEPSDEIPFEDRPLRDAALFRSFGQRATNLLRPLVAAPLVDEWWPDACRQMRWSGNLGQCLAAARHRLERAWGLETLELPLSVVCDTPSFRWFAVYLLSEAPRLRDVYNGALAEYRRVHHLRGKSHPVPELARDDPWVEAPFWIWTAEVPRRRRVFVRRRGEQLEITDRGAQTIVLALPGDGDPRRAVDQLADWSRAGVRLRPRALMTTLYARLVLSDLFLHGIGGAQYDQLTDALLRRFFRCHPPAFLTLTATAQLPIVHSVVTHNDVRDAQRMLRDLWFHPERHLDSARAVSQDSGRTFPGADPRSADPRPLVDAKLRWLTDDAPRGRRRPRHRALADLNEALRQFVAPLREQWLERCATLEAEQRRHALLSSREFSFCLFPGAELRRLLLELSVIAL